jgi:hypothetical protein
VEGDQENKTGQETFSTDWHHRELGQEATSIKHTLLLNLSRGFSAASIGK